MFEASFPTMSVFYVSVNSWMIGEWWTGKDLEGTDHGLIEIIILTSHGRLRTTETLRTAGVPDDIRTRHPQT